MTIGILWNPEAFSIDSSTYNGNKINEVTGHNTGNLAYVEGIRSIFEGEDIEFLPWTIKGKSISSSIDKLIFPAANQLGKHTDLGGLASVFSNYDRPVVALGLGAQLKDINQKLELSAGTSKWLETLTKLKVKKDVPNIIVRGDITARKMEEMGYGGSIISSGCPSQFIAKDILHYKKIQDNIRFNELNFLAYNASHYSWAWASDFDKKALDYIFINGGGMLVQAPYEYIDLVKFEYNKDYTKSYDIIRNFFKLNLTNPEIKKIIRRYFYTFSNITSWRDWVSKHDFTIGTRIHGAMVGLQSGVPSLLIVHDTRTLELAEKIGVPFIMANDERIKTDFLNTCKKTLLNFDYKSTNDKRLRNLNSYLRFFRKNEINVGSKFSDFAENIKNSKELFVNTVKSAPSIYLEKSIDTRTKIIEFHDGVSYLPVNWSQNSSVLYFDVRKDNFSDLINKRFDIIVINSLSFEISSYENLFGICDSASLLFVRITKNIHDFFINDMDKPVDNSINHSNIIKLISYILNKSSSDINSIEKSDKDAQGRIILKFVFS